MRAETKERYPDNWPEISQACIERANRICKDCSRSDRTDPIVLTSHHKDYDPSNNANDNLACLCQGCHLHRQGKDLAEATKYRKIELLLRMGQLAFPGLLALPPKRLTRVIEGVALATSRGSKSRVQLSTGRVKLPSRRAYRG